MKRILYYFCLLLSAGQVQAQFYIGPGATVSINGAGVKTITLENTDFINDGTFLPGTSDFHFINSDGNNLAIAGEGSTAFDYVIVRLENEELTLEQDIEANRVIFQSGNFNLNGSVVNLNEIILNEDENHSFIGPNGGAIVHQANLANPVNQNPGNLGAVISADADLGEVTIRRSHQAVMNNGVESIGRVYDIEPSNNQGLNATLRFTYLEKELNGLSEDGLRLWRNEGSGWDLAGVTERSLADNWLELSGIDAFSDWTAADNTFTNIMEIAEGQWINVGAITPNPLAKENGRFHLPVTSPEKGEMNIELIDQYGRVIYRTKEMLAVGEQLLQVETEGLSSGSYFVRLTTAGQYTSLKLIIQ